MDHNEIQNLNRGMESAPIESILPHPMNPNRGNVVAIEESIENIGWFGATLIQKSTRRIIAGEHRWRAMKKKNADHIDVILLDCDDATALRIMLADNEFARLSRSDNKKLGQALLQIQESGQSMSGFGVSELRAERLLSAIRTEPLKLEIEATEQASDSLSSPNATPDASGSASSIPSFEIPDSDIRQIMLFVHGSEHPETMKMLKVLKTFFVEANNNSQVILEAIKFAYMSKVGAE